jgi:hypothetical protein
MYVATLVECNGIVRLTSLLFSLTGGCYSCNFVPRLLDGLGTRLDSLSHWWSSCLYSYSQVLGTVSISILVPLQSLSNTRKRAGTVPDSGRALSGLRGSLLFVVVFSLRGGSGIASHGRIRNLSRCLLQRNGTSAGYTVGGLKLCCSVYLLRERGQRGKQQVAQLLACILQDVSVFVYTYLGSHRGTVIYIRHGKWIIS